MCKCGEQEGASANHCVSSSVTPVCGLEQNIEQILGNCLLSCYEMRLFLKQVLNLQSQVTLVQHLAFKVREKSVFISFKPHESLCGRIT